LARTAVGTVADLRRWLADAGFDASIEVSGLFAFFNADRRDTLAPPART
jgi:hypothetical protein